MIFYFLFVFLTQWGPPGCPWCDRQEPAPVHLPHAAAGLPPGLAQGGWDGALGAGSVRWERWASWGWNADLLRGCALAAACLGDSKVTGLETFIFAPGRGRALQIESFYSCKNTVFFFISCDVTTKQVPWWLHCRDGDCQWDFTARTWCCVKLQDLQISYCPISSPFYVLWKKL